MHYFCLQVPNKSIKLNFVFFTRRNKLNFFQNLTKYIEDIYNPTLVYFSLHVKRKCEVCVDRCSYSVKKSAVIKSYVFMCIYVTTVSGTFYTIRNIGFLFML